ncbi:hypothetical protein F5141DRAFT_73980 [Pisolithus sp. B1]|nr:hypothetical protein F5141DRAFT_73980 [Pisolithus sp. B1]
MNTELSQVRYDDDPQKCFSTGSYSLRGQSATSCSNAYSEGGQGRHVARVRVPLPQGADATLFKITFGRFLGPLFALTASYFSDGRQIVPKKKPLSALSHPPAPALILYTYVRRIPTGRLSHTSPGSVRARYLLQIPCSTSSFVGSSCSEGDTYKHITDDVLADHPRPDEVFVEIVHQMLPFWHDDAVWYNHGEPTESDFMNVDELLELAEQEAQTEAED